VAQTQNSTPRRVGAGVLVSLGALAVVALGMLVAWLLVHRTKPHMGTTIHVTTAPPTTTRAG
jgi:hypothetical protein